MANGSFTASDGVARVLLRRRAVEGWESCNWALDPSLPCKEGMLSHSLVVHSGRKEGTSVGQGAHPRKEI